MFSEYRYLTYIEFNEISHTMELLDVPSTGANTDRGTYKSSNSWSAT